MPSGFAPDLFLDIQFNMTNGTYHWRNGPEINLSEWLFTGIGTPNHPYVPKWVHFRFCDINCNQAYR